MVVGTDLEIFAVYLCANITISIHVCLNLSNSKIRTHIAKTVSQIVQNFALYAENPRNLAPFLGTVPLKTRDSTNVAIFEAPLYKL